MEQSSDTSKEPEERRKTNQEADEQNSSEKKPDPGEESRDTAAEQAIEDDAVPHWSVDSVKVDVLITRVRKFLYETIHIRDGVDVDATVKDIKANIDFGGYNIWILICSIAVACIGLIGNSPAVIIGAMLISPLMGPIRGIGLATGINDLKLLFYSLKNFGLMVGVSLLAAFIFFLINPLKTETAELLARTRPHILDVGVAFFGGIAGIVAASRRDVATVIPGVAIATALMPPLCTAGYGLATGKMAFFFGASYMFLLNALFICLSTILIVRYLRFPYANYINPKTRKKVQWYIVGFLALVMIPSGFKFVQVIKESLFLARSEEYVETIIKPYEDAHVNTTRFRYDSENPVIEISFVGKNVPEEVLREWRRRLADFSLENATLKVYQNSTDASISADYLMETQKQHKLNLEQMATDLRTAEEENKTMRGKLKKLEKYTVDLGRLDEKIKFSFPDLREYFYAPAIISNMGGVRDTMVTVLARWTKESEGYEEMLNEKLEAWLKLELNHKNVVVIPYSNEIEIKKQSEQPE